MKNENFVDFSWIINVITRRKWLIIIPLAISVIASLAIMIFLPPGYKATTTLMVEPSENYKTSELNVLMAGERMALTYSRIIISRPILEEVISQLDMDLSTSELADMVTVQPIESTQLIQISVNNPAADQAVAIVNSISSAFISYIGDLTTETYNHSLNNNQERIDLKQAEINSIITNINTQNKLKADVETEKSKLELLLSRNRDNYLTLQQNAQTLELTISASTNKVSLVEPAYIISSGTQPPYVASLTIFFSRDIVTGSTDPTINISGLIGQIYGPMLSRETLLSKVINQLSLSETAVTLSYRISYEAVAGTQFLKLNVSYDDPAQAILIADTLGTFFVDQVQSNLAISDNKLLTSLEDQMAEISTQMDIIQEDISNNSTKTIPIDLEIARLNNELSSKYLDLRSLQTSYDQLTLEAGRAANTVVVSDPATHAKTISNKTLYVGVLVLLAMIASIGLVFLFENLDDRVRTEADILGLLVAKPIGIISHIARGKDKLIFGSNSSPHVSEDFRKLSAVIRPTLRELPLRRLLVTSPYSGEGKSIVAANLGQVFAKTGTSVIIMDADLHLPRQHILFDVAVQGGLSEYLTSKLTESHLKSVDTQNPGLKATKAPRLKLKATKIPNLKLLTSGIQPDDPAELLSTPYLEKVLDNLTERARLVIIDSPPIVTLADASYLTPYVDGALLVIRSSSTKRKAALEAATILKNAGIKFVGIVLNDVPEPPDTFYQYYDAKAGDSQG
jgi:capsular exopolysaccharide synthesis family protein